MKIPAALLERSDLTRVREDRRLQRQGLRTSPFDIVSSLLLALILFTSAAVLFGFLMWLTRGPVEPHKTIPPVEFGSQDNQTSLGAEDEFEKPTASEIESLQEPSLEETIEAVADVAGTFAVSAEAVASDATSNQNGSSPGSLRSPGPDIDGELVVPRYERWQLEFSANDLVDYAKQLDGATFRILKRALPGPYTFILPSAKALPAPFNKKKTVGIRVPENNIARALAAALGRPIATASLHDQDEIIDYTTDPDSIFEDWNLKVSAIVDAGMGGLVPSTVIDLSQDEPLVIREGLGDVGVI